MHDCNDTCILCYATRAIDIIHGNCGYVAVGDLTPHIYGRLNDLSGVVTVTVLMLALFDLTKLFMFIDSMII